MFQHFQILPKNGTTFYIPGAMNENMSDMLFRLLLERVPWKQDEVMLYGKRIVTKRKYAWFGDEEYGYNYSNAKRKAMPWTKDLLETKETVERICHVSFNCCLLNLYHNGSEGMGWHSDDEKEMQENGLIASLSLGAGRIFRFKHKLEPLQTELLLENGSLLLMGGETQKFWKHQLPVSRKVTGTRINLTFRNFVGRTGK